MLTLKDFDSLLGKWKLIGKDETYEIWEKESDSRLDGRGYSIVDGKEIINEALQVVLRGSGIYYVATVAHNAGPIEFKLHAYDDDTTVFENLEHDFPQRIKYEFVENGSLLVQIENRDSTKRIQYRFERVE